MTKTFVHDQNIYSKLNALISVAESKGATKIAIVDAKKIVVEDALAEYCRKPGCKNYGLSMSCPPHVSGPLGFRKNLEIYDNALFFRIDVPLDILYSSEKRKIFRLLHEIAASIEHSAHKMGFVRAKAFAGGSCKDIFCHEHLKCRVLSEKGQCRYPDHARPSMSGFGINVTALAKTVGWTMDWGKPDASSDAAKLGNIYGLVLIC